MMRKRAGTEPGDCEERLAQALERIAAPDGEGCRACLTVYSDAAMVAARAADARRAEGQSDGPLDGWNVSIKDLFDVAGEATRGGSRALAHTAPLAERDAAVVERLRSGGAIIVAKTNMSEFAFSGVGLNPHFGTPGNPADRGRVPGGSSSGAAVSVADGFCEIAIGTDTGGSVRIPAALCGLVGFKPTRSQVPLEGALPLSYSLDSIGPIARTVEQCTRAFSVLSGRSVIRDGPRNVGGLRLGAVQGLPLQGVDGAVGEAYERTLATLSSAGASVFDCEIPEIAAFVEIGKLGGIVPAEAYHAYRHLVEGHPREIDPLILLRLENGSRITAADYIEMLHRRRDLLVAMKARMADVDALVMPTVPIVAPTFDEVGTPEGFGERNALLLRNTSIANFFDLPSISLPIPGTPLPVGLMLTAASGEDERLLSTASALEALLNE